MARVLVVDDDKSVREVVASYLRAYDHEPIEAGDGEQAVELMREDCADLVVLDLMLPGMGGLDVARHLRRTSEVPIIMLTALGQPTDRVAGLEIGADDYMSKPFSPRELVLRVDSVLRRTGQASPRTAIAEDGDLVIDSGSRVVTLRGEPVSLTTREFDLLWFLVTHPGQAFTREELLKQVWGWTFGDQSTVTVHVRRLREKIEREPVRPTRLHTVWGVGYRWELQP